MAILGNELLEGEKVRLNAATPEDLPQYAAWFSTDMEMMQMLGVTPVFPMTLADEEAWLEQTHQNPDTYSFAIRTLAENRLIGNCALMHPNWQARSAEVGIAIGSPDMRGKGYGTDAMRVIIRYGFMELNLHRVYLRVHSYNQRAIAAYNKIGFVHEGTIREAIQRDGRFFDTHYMGLLRREWEAQVNEK